MDIKASRFTEEMGAVQFAVCPGSFTDRNIRRCSETENCGFWAMETEHDPLPKPIADLADNADGHRIESNSPALPHLSGSAAILAIRIYRSFTSRVGMSSCSERDDVEDARE